MSAATKLTGEKTSAIHKSQAMSILWLSISNGESHFRILPREV